ncbi:Site-specific recombinase XerD [Pseudonocardia thermophila]|uniref:Site-specific recombinase XerD n=1 Tax=Pseudonocardia thermophila TaxID=1848 RepID=A0A1M6NHG3_PSETH|nr:tyrosine-type recombinase/integrase [Pseudonocardia thermophila]SHJ95178.1 Site-specific recombinase XerD [Pseudonocardia thermophila]
MITDALAVLEPLPRTPAPRAASDGSWPGVDDPDALREQIAGWLAQYANPGTRRTYAHALGLPVTWADALGGRAAPQPEPRAGHRPPPAGKGRLHDLAWFRWCAARALDPRTATTAHVTAWLHELEAHGAARRTRQRMLSTLSALYGHLALTGVVAANPAALHRGRLGLTGGARDASPTVRLTAEQLAALLRAAPTLHYARDPALDALLARRATAVVALLTLGLRISELTGLDRSDRYRTGGEDVLRVVGKGGRHREVYLTDLAREALEDYLAERDRFTGSAVPAVRGRTGAADEPLIATRTGNRCSRTDLYRLLRRIAAAAGPELDGVADRVHPHALRHAYVTIALENGIPIQHVRADVGHASIATTEHYDRGLRTRATTGADAVAAAISARSQ